jgi:hypothetical protein
MEVSEKFIVKLVLLFGEKDGSLAESGQSRAEQDL